MKNLWSTILLFFFGLSLFGQSYDRLWKQVEEASRNDLPRQALSQVQTIYEKATKDGNDVQLLKSHLALIQYNFEISTDSILPFTRAMEEAMTREKRPLQRSLWHSAIAQVYENNLRAFMLQGMSYDEVKAKVQDQYDASLANPELLMAMSYKAFLPLFDEHRDSRYFNDDCLHVLYHAYQKSDLLSQRDKQKCIEKIKQVYERFANYDAVVLLTLDELDGNTLSTDVNGVIENNPYYQKLLRLYETYSQHPASLYVLTRMVSLYRSSYADKYDSEYNTDNNNRNDSILYAWTEKALNNPLYKNDKEGLAYFNTLRAEFNAPSVFIPGLQREYYPSDVVTLSVTNRNVEMLTFRIIPLFNDCADYDRSTAESRRRIVRRHRVVGKVYEYMPIGTPRHWGKFTLNMRVPEKPGVYELEVLVNNEKVESRTFQVTALAPLAFSVNRNQHRLLVVDRRTGFPVKGAKVRAYVQGRGKSFTRYNTTDGELLIDLSDSPDRNQTFYVHTADDYGSSPWHLYSGYGYYSPQMQKSRRVIDLFTDRAIYRPGQTVHFSGVAYAKEGDMFRVDSTLHGEISCYDVNRKKVDSLQVRTDGFGSFQGSFTLPETGMNGIYQLVFSSAAQEKSRLSFRVEEYKRPTLQVHMLTSQERYRLNDSVTVEGIAETYTGLPVAGALVAFQVQHTSWWSRTAETESQYGELRTDETGHFKFKIKLAASDERPWLRSYNCHFFHVKCAVTADNGETAQGETVFRAETRRAYLQLDFPAVLCKEHLPECRLSLLNAAGEELGDSVSCQLWQGDKLLHTERFQAGQPVRPQFCKSVPSGNYRLVLHVDDEVEDLEKSFSLFSIHDVQIPDTSVPFFAYQHQSAESDSVEVYIGTSADEALVYYQLVAGDSLLDSRRIPLDKRLHRLELTYRPEYGDAATAYLAMVRDNRLHTYSYTVRKPLPDKKLKLSWTTFRSRLSPGQQEEWRLRITRPDGTPARAQLMACLYDASLDQLASRTWQFSAVSVQRMLPRAQWTDQGFYNENGYVLSGTLGSNVPFYPPLPSLTEWKESLLNYYHPFRFRAYGQGVPQNRCTKALAMEAACDVDMGMEAPAVNMAVAESEAVPSFDESGPQVQVRSNFAETAFFQPALRTDAQGEVSLSFTLPETMTQWNFKALAHDAEMNHGSLLASVVARKAFMVQPAMPRFLRHGDRTLLPVTVTNLSGKSVHFELSLTLEHGVHEGQLLKRFVQSVDLASDQSKVLHFEFPVHFDVPFVICRVVAEGEGFSDGEEHLLPICSEKVEVTRTIPFSLRHAGTYTVDIPDWLKQKKVSHPVLGVELTSNPMWYTLSALPVLAERQHNLTANDWATVYYASRLGSHVASLHPEIHRMVEQCGEELEEAFASRWTKLDDCTPWLDRAQNEARRVRELRTLLDGKEAAKRMDKALHELKVLQKGDGGWSWCPGMNSNVWTTLDVALLLARSQYLTGATDGQAMLRKSYAYLRQKMSESVEQMKRQEKKYKKKLPVTETHLNYLYLTILLGEKPHGFDDFLLERAAGLRKELTMYGKAVAARVLSQTGYQAESQMALQSLLEHTTVTAENGRFFDNSRALSSYSAYRIPTQCATIETLRDFGRDSEADEMMLWLLQAKRTQMWNTPRASTDAVFTLLSAAGAQPSFTSLTGREPLSYTLYQGRQVVASASADTLQTRHTTGYLRETYTDEAAVCADRLEVNQPSEGLSWGSVYATFRQAEDQVVKSGSGFDLTYTFEVFEEGQWEKFRLGKPLHKGMRLRRIYTMKADKDYDFVKLRADRPACFVPLQALSGYRFFDRFAAYLQVRDQATEYYIEHLAKGTYRFTEEFFVDRSGVYATGISRISCLQAPEYTAVTPSIWLHVE